MRKVTIIGGQHTTGDGVVHQIGEEVEMEDADAEWYTQQVIAGRQAVQPISSVADNRVADVSTLNTEDATER